MLAWMSELLNTFAAALMAVLPVSPFKAAIDGWIPPDSLGWLNWFFPVGACLKVMLLWLGSVALFYLYSILMRWLKIIGD